jgi:sugar lactone lactonase YvrE
MTIDFKPLIDARFELGEGPVYDDRRAALWFCDIVGRALHRITLGALELGTWTFPSEVCSIGLAESGRVVVALRDEVGMFDPDTCDYRQIAQVGLNPSEARLNDGKVGPDGAFWVGSMVRSDARPGEPAGALYRVDANGTVERKVDGIATSNGLAFSPDGAMMFHTDTRAPWIDRWKFDETSGAISERKRIAMPDDTIGRPDGGATDAEGCYWSAGISAARLNRFSADGELLESHPVPVGAPTMPCFGADGLGTLFVTSLRDGRPPELLERYPLTGSVLVAKSPVAGSPVGRFRDQ